MLSIIILLKIFSYICNYQFLYNGKIILSYVLNSQLIPWNSGNKACFIGFLTSSHIFLWQGNIYRNYEEYFSKIV
jgi:hypothetical protein